MTTPAHTRYAGYRFPAEIIGHAVWLYFRFPLVSAWWRSCSPLAASSSVKKLLAQAHACRGALEMLNPQMNSRGAVRHRPRPASVAEPTISPDSLLERRGFELPVPLAKRVGLSGGTGGAAEAKKDCPESNLSCGGDRGFESSSLHQGVLCEPPGSG